MTDYHNENNPYAAAWLRNLIKQGLLPHGHVDERSIADVQPGDLRGYRHVHLFSGIGGWSLAAKLAGWPDDRELWTGSCPCQGESIAGKKLGKDDPRHLWPDMFRLVRACRPAVVMGEQVARAAGTHWLDGVWTDLESENYAVGAQIIPACAVDAPHIRSRLWWCAVADARLLDRGSRSRYSRDGQERADLHASSMADTLCVGGRQDTGRASADEAAYGRARRLECQSNGDHVPGSDAEGTAGCGLVHPESVGWREGWPEPEFRSGRPTTAEPDVSGGSLDYADGAGQQGFASYPRDDGEEQSATQRANVGHRPNGSFWAGAEWIRCHDGKARRAEPGIPLLADGIPGRVALWRGIGNAISPVLAAEVLKAFLDCYP